MKGLYGVGVAALGALVMAVALAGCPGGEGPRDACEQVVCGRGRCVTVEGQASCECEPGTHAEGLTCVPDDVPPSNPCEPNPCVQPGRGQCGVVDGGAVCACDPGTEELPGGGCGTPNPCEPNPCTTPNKTVCSVSGGEAVCSCDTGHVPDEEGCRPEPVVTCAGQHSTGDAFEPDECPALARQVDTAGGPAEPHTLSPAGDEDWVRFTASTGHVYEIHVLGESGVVPHVDVYGADGVTVLASAHEGGAEVRLVHKAAGAGDLLVRIRAQDGTPGGAYGLSLQDLGADDFPDEPALATSETVPGGTPVAGALQFNGDRDVVRFALSGGHVYRFEAAWAPASGEALLLELLDEHGVVVASSRSASPRLTTRVTAPGTWFLRLSEPTGKRRAAYTFTATDLGLDDHGDTPAESSPVVIGGPPASGGFERPDDVDLFSFEAEAGHVYAFTCNPGGGAADCLVSLSDAAGNVLATDNNGGTGYIAYEYALAGTYYFRVSSSSTGSYTYRLEDLGPDDHGDDFGSATPLTPSPTVVSGRVETPGDVDVFSFEGLLHTTYAFSCTSRVIPCRVTLYDANGVELLADDTSERAKVTYGVKAAGTFYVKVQAATGATGVYGYTLENLGTDDHGDTPAEATPITPSESATGAALEEAGDVDVFRFSAEAGHIYEFTCSTSAFDCNVDLVDGSGTVLASDLGSSLVAQLRYEVGAAGTYYFRVKSAGDAGTGAYSWRLRDLGLDDHGDTRGSATALTPSTTATAATLETSGDVDVFSFSGLLNTAYAFTCTSSAIECHVTLYDASGTLLVLGTGSTAKVTYVVRSAGTFYVAVEATTVEFGSYSYKLENLGTDDHGNTRAEATSITPSGSATGARLEAPGDVDVFSFAAQAGHIYALTCDTTAFDCNVSLEDSAGGVLASDVSSASVARVRYEMMATGTYYFRVEARGAGFGAYSYTLVDLGLDDHGDTLGTATALTPSTTARAATLETSGDVDVFSFPGLLNTAYAFTCTPSGFDCNVTLHDASGTVLVSDIGSASTAKVTYVVRSAGTFYVKVQGGTAGDLGAYSYTLENLGTDDHGNTRAEATLITPSGSATGAELEAAGDVDVFGFAVQAGHIYELTCGTAAFDCNVYLEDAAGTVLASDTASSTSARVVHEAVAAGTWYLRVQARGTGFGAYTYTLVDLGPDDHGDAFETATALAVPTPSTSGKLETPGDVDVFSFEGTARTFYAFACSSSAFACSVTVYDASGTVLIAASGASVRPAYEVQTAGTFYVKVLAGSATATGAYSYALERLGTDDHGDTPAEATSITPVDVFTGASLEISADVDVFGFNAEAGHIYELTCSTTGFDCNASLLNASGTVLASDVSAASVARVRYEVGPAGTYYFRVWSGSSSGGAYSYKLVDLGVDDHGDDLAMATAISPSSAAIAAILETSGDVDVFSFSGSVNTTYAFTCTTSAFDCDVILYDANGVVLLSDTASGSTGKVTYVIKADGTYFVKVFSGSSAYGTYSYKLENLGADDHGNFPYNATPIAPSATAVSARINDASDVDVFAFNAEAGHIYEFTCGTSAFDCDAALIDAAGAVLASDTASLSTAVVRYEFNTAGTWYFRVYKGGSTFGSYTYKLLDLGLDDYGDSIATATPVTATTGTAYVAGNLETVGDVEVFAFNAEAGHIYEFHCSTSSIECDLYFLDAAGTVLRSDTLINDSAVVVHEFNTAGTYYVRLVGGGYRGAYQWRLRDLGFDDYGDSIATATPVTATTGTAYVAGNLETVGDVEVFAFNAEAGHIYEFHCSTSSIECDLYFLDAAGTVLRSDTLINDSAVVVHEFNTAGTYYVRLVGGGYRGAYQWRLRDVGSDDYGDSIAMATPVSATTGTAYVAGNLETEGDVEVFAFNAEVGHIYEFHCSTSSIECDLYFLDAAGTVLRSDTLINDSAVVVHEFNTAGTYYVRLVGGGYRGAYQWRLRDLGLDDYGDSIATATPVTAITGTAYAAGNLETEGDVEVFAFNAEVGHIYEFHCSTSSIECDLYFLDAAGTVLRSDTLINDSAVVVHEFNTAGTYYVRLVGGGYRGAYQWRLRDLGVDDHADSAAGATPLTLGTATAGVLEMSSDVDFFAVSLTAGTAYTATTTGLATTLTVYAPNGTTTVPTGSSPRTFTPSTSGTFYVRVAGTSVGSYSLTVQ